MTSSLDRRTFLAAGLTTAGVLAVPAAPRLARAASRPPLAGEVAFAQGVASGQPARHGITLWTQVGGLERAARVRLEVSPDADFRRIVHRETVVARPSRGFAVHARVSGRKLLDPGERYFYRFASRRTDSPVGRFRTALPADSREPVRIGFFSCQDYESGYFTAHEALAAEQDLDLVVSLGDYIYEKSFDPSPTRRDTLGANGDGEVMLLDEYRAKYALYHADPALQEVRRRHPVLAVWDDHEVEDNHAADQPGKATEDRRIPYEQRRVNAYRAFFEAMPRIRHPRERDRIYGGKAFGRNLEILLTDQRQYRTDQPCGDQQGNASCPEVDDPDATLLGAEQKAWLKRRLDRSKATWKVVGSQVMVMALDGAPGVALNPDQWDGYRAERTELLSYLHDRGIDNVSFITGDIHTFFAGDVTVEGRQSRPGSPAAVATEFVGGSITSKAISDRFGEDGRPVFEPGGAVALQTTNPHLRYANDASKGYGVLEARPDELLVQFKSPGTTQAPRSLTRTIARFRVPAGVAAVERVG